MYGFIVYVIAHACFLVWTWKRPEFDGGVFLVSFHDVLRQDLFLEHPEPSNLADLASHLPLQISCLSAFWVLGLEPGTCM